MLKEAHLIVDGDVVNVPVKILLEVIVLNKSGEKIPSNGIIIEGERNISESMVSLMNLLPVDTSWVIEL